MSVLLRLGYEGTGFHGYASQRPRPDGSVVRTVQGELETALQTLYKQPVATRAASRTDAGVHALGQLAVFEAPGRIPMPGLIRGLNTQLSADLSVFAAWEEPGEVNVRRLNDGKYYRYRIRSTEIADPLSCRTEWHLGRRLDPWMMRDAAERFCGTHDFGSFRASACQAKTTERTIRAVDVTFGSSVVGPIRDQGRLDAQVQTGEKAPGPVSTWGPDWVEIHVRGTAFLQNMVRIMVGTLVEVGLGRRSPREIEDLLRVPDRTKAGMTAPARGLTLVEVLWPSTGKEASSCAS